jgi:hypothetical protein
MIKIKFNKINAIDKKIKAIDKKIETIDRRIKASKQTNEIKISDFSRILDIKNKLLNISISKNQN